MCKTHEFILAKIDRKCKGHFGLTLKLVPFVPDTLSARTVRATSAARANAPKLESKDKRTGVGQKGRIIFRVD